MENLFLFEGLSKQQITQITSCLQEPFVFEKGDVIYGANEESAIGVLLEGKAECVARSGGVLMKVFHPGEVFGAATIFGNAPVSRITALTSCRVQYIPQQILMGWIENYPTISLNYIRFLSEKVRFLNRKIALLTMDSVQARVMEYLLSQADASDTVEIRNMSQLAKTLGVGRTSLYRSLDELTENGWITRKEHQIQIREKQI